MLARCFPNRFVLDFHRVSRICQQAIWWVKPVGNDKFSKGEKVKESRLCIRNEALFFFACGLWQNIEKGLRVLPTSTPTFSKASRIGLDLVIANLRGCTQQILLLADWLVVSWLLNFSIGPLIFIFFCSLISFFRDFLMPLLFRMPFEVWLSP